MPNNNTDTSQVICLVQRKLLSCYVNSIVLQIQKYILQLLMVRHSLMLLWFADLMNVTEEVTIHRPKVSTLLSSAFIRGINGIET